MNVVTNPRREILDHVSVLTDSQEGLARVPPMQNVNLFNNVLSNTLQIRLVLSKLIYWLIAEITEQEKMRWNDVPANIKMCNLC